MKFNSQSGTAASVPAQPDIYSRRQRTQPGSGKLCACGHMGISRLGFGPFDGLNRVVT